MIAILGDEPDSTRVASAMTKVNVPWQRTASARDIDPPREDDWDVAKHRTCLSCTRLGELLDKISQKIVALLSNYINYELNFDEFCVLY